MLERAPACLEQGARCLLSTPRKAHRSRRALHSAFWTHGAGDIDLPSWWIALLQRSRPKTSRSSQSITEAAKRCLSAGLADGGFLDFLYSAKTLALIHKLAVRDVARSGSRSRAPFPRFSRLYSSGASEELREDPFPTLVAESDRDRAESFVAAIQEKQAQEAAKRVQLPQNASKRPPIDVVALKELRKQIRDLQLQLVGNLETPLARAEIHEDRLMRLGRLVQEALIEHSLYLLERLRSKPSLGIKDLAAKLEAYYHLKRFTPVLDLYTQTLDRHQDHATTPTIVRLAFDFNDWKLAFRSWDIYRGTLQDESYFWREALKTDLVAFANTTYSMIEAADHQLRDIRKEREPKNLRDFAISLAETFLGHLNRMNPELQCRIPPGVLGNIFWKLEALKSANFVTYEQYRLFLGPLLGHTSASRVYQAEAAIVAMQIYNRTRKNPGIVVEQDFLEKLLELACRTHHSDAKTVCEDLKSRYGCPSLDLLQVMLVEHEYQGDVKSFYAVLGDAQQVHGLKWTADTALRLLRMFARRREPTEAQTLFDSIESRTGKKPTAAHWEELVATYANVDDITNALERLEGMTASGLAPDVHTYEPLFEYYARRGEAEALNELVQALKEKELPIHSFVYRSLVRAHIVNLQLDEAEVQLFETLNLDFEGPRGPMWGDLAREYAKQRRKTQMFQLLDEMARHGIPQGDEVLQGFIILYTLYRRPMRAFDLVRRSLPVYGITATSNHYALVMTSFISCGQPRMVPIVEKAMSDRGVRPDFNVKQLVLRAAVRVDTRLGGENWGKSPDKVFLSRAEAKLDELLASSDRGDMAVAGNPSIIGVSHASYDEAHASNYFAIILQAYGRQGAYKQAGLLYDRYIAGIRHRAPDQPVEPPVKLLAWLMGAFRHDRAFQSVEQGWRLALAKATKLAARRDADLAQPNWVLPARNHILSLPLVEYMAALFDQRRFDAVEILVAEVQRMGFVLDSRAWNIYVQGHAGLGDARHAFVTAEKHLIPGWVARRRSWPSSRGRRHRHWIAILEARLPREHERLSRIPTYKTMVLLAAGYVRLREQWAVEDRRETGLRDLLSVAPRTVEQVTLMPRKNDRFQRAYLLNQ